jgi:hypothetical protein
VFEKLTSPLNPLSGTVHGTTIFGLEGHVSLTVGFVGAQRAAPHTCKHKLLIFGQVVFVADAQKRIPTPDIVCRDAQLRVRCQKTKAVLGESVKLTGKGRSTLRPYGRKPSRFTKVSSS